MLIIYTIQKSEVGNQKSKPMKTKLILSALCVILPCVAGAQSLYDNFNGSSINSSLWTIYNPPDGSPSVTEANGNANFINGSTLITVSSFSDAIVSGSFQITGDNDGNFNIMLRSDGTSFDSHWEEPSSGIQMVFYSSSNPSQTPSLRIIDRTTQTVLAYASPDIDMDTYYNFLITDSGSQINVFLGDSNNPIISAQTTLSYGNKIELFNRSQIDWWGPQHSAELDYVTISEVPEPSTFCLFGLSALLLGWKRFK